MTRLRDFRNSRKIQVGALVEPRCRRFFIVVGEVGDSLHIPQAWRWTLNWFPSATIEIEIRKTVRRHAIMASGDWFASFRCAFCLVYKFHTSSTSPVAVRNLPFKALHTVSNFISFSRWELREVQQISCQSPSWRRLSLIELAFATKNDGESLSGSKLGKDLVVLRVSHPPLGTVRNFWFSLSDLSSASLLMPGFLYHHSPFTQNVKIWSSSSALYLTKIFFNYPLVSHSKYSLLNTK